MELSEEINPARTLVEDSTIPAAERLKAARALILHGQDPQVLDRLRDLVPRHRSEIRKLEQLAEYVQRTNRELDFSGDQRWETLDGQAPGTSRENSGVLLWVRPGARKVVLAFSNVGGGFGWLKGWYSIWLIHDALRHLDTSIIYLRDAGLVHFGGIHGLAGDYPGCIGALKTMFDARGWSDCYTLGDSAGGYAAMRYGLDLDARAVMCMSGVTTLDPADELGRYPTLERVQRELPDYAVDLLLLYRARVRRPRLLLCYGTDNASDRAHAQRMAELPDADMVRFQGLARHSTLLASRGRTLGALLDLLVRQ